MSRSYRDSPSVLRLRVPHGDGDSSYPFGPDVQGRVQVSVMHRPTPAGPNPVREGQGGVDCPTLPTKLAAGEVAVNHGEVFAVPDRFVLQLPPELTQGCVQNREGKLGFRHPSQVQVFDAQPVVFLDEFGGQLVQPVLALVAHLGVDPVQPMPRLFPVLATLLLAGKFPLRPAKLALCFAVELGWSYSCTVGKHREVFQAEVNSYHPFRVCRGQGCVRHGEFGGQGDVPMPLRIPLERSALDGAINRLALANLDQTDLGDIDFGVFDFDPLGDAEARLIPLLAFEAGEPGPLFKERLERPVEVFQGLLEHLAIGFFQPCHFGPLLQGGQLGGLLVVGQPLPGGGIRLLAPCKAPVPHEPPSSGHTQQSLSLGLGGFHAEAVDLAMDSHSVPRFSQYSTPATHHAMSARGGRGGVHVSHP